MGSADTERLEELLSRPESANDVALKTALTRLSAEIKQRLAKNSGSQEFFDSALAALGKFKGSKHGDVRMTCLWDCMQFFYFNGLSHKALSSAVALNVLASQVGNEYWVRKAAMMTGVANADVGNVAEGLLHHAKALEYAMRQRDLEGEVSVLVNTGVALNYGALYQEAIPCFRRAAKLAKEAGLDSYLPSIFVNLAQTYHSLDQVPEGFEAAKLAILTSTEPKDMASAMSAITREYTFVQLALELGKLREAREHAKACTRHALWCGSPRGRVLSDIANGLCEVYGGQVEKGFQLLESALRLGSETDAVRSVVLIALVKAYDAANQPERALDYLHKLLEHKRETRNKSLASLFSLPIEFVDSSYVSGEIDLRALELKRAELKATVAERQVTSTRLEMLERLAVTADLKEETSGEHGYRVGKLCALLALEVGFDSSAAHAIETAARLHDIGKLGVPDRILLSSVALNVTERHFMSTHAIIGAELLAKSNIPQLRIAEEIARCHHEWWNGEGYPSKLARKRIPIHARIVALADVFDALTHGRPFAKPWPMDRAIEEIKKRKGTQFDPELTDVFVDLIQRLRTEHEDLDEYLGRAGRNSPFLQARNKIRLMLAEERENEKIATVEGNETRH